MLFINAFVVKTIQFASLTSRDYHFKMDMRAIVALALVSCLSDTDAKQDIQYELGCPRDFTLVKEVIVGPGGYLSCLLCGQDESQQLICRDVSKFFYLIGQVKASFFGNDNLNSFFGYHDEWSVVLVKGSDRTYQRTREGNMLEVVDKSVLCREELRLPKRFQSTWVCSNGIKAPQLWYLVLLLKLLLSVSYCSIWETI